MKSLKRTLSLVLALVMVLGLFGGISMTAAASDFTDDAEVQYKEAVDVMTGIGAINGMGDGTFKPKDNITRAEAATMITRAVIGKSAASKLTGVTSSFSDVPADKYKWAIPSIEYLRDAGIISGVGGNAFNPEGDVTGYEIGKMLLCALGYGKNGEFTGKGWDLKVALFGSRESNIDPRSEENENGTNTMKSVFSDRSSTANALENPASREEVALYCLNTIQLPQVEWIETLKIYAGEGSILGNKLGSIAKNVYPTLDHAFPGSAEGVDGLGNPADVWTFNGKEVGAYAETAAQTWNTAKSEADLKKELKGLKVTEAITPKVNGDNGDAKESFDALVTYLTEQSGNGTVVNVYTDKAGNVTNVTIVKTLIASVSTIDPATKAVTLANATYESVIELPAISADSSLYSKVANVKEGDYVLVVPVSDGEDGYNIQSVDIPNQVTGKITTVLADGTVTLEGNNYKKAASLTEDANNLKAVDGEHDATLWLDNNGFVVHHKNADAPLTSDMMIVLDVYQSVVDDKLVTKAKVLYTNGTTADILLDVGLGEGASLADALKDTAIMPMTFTGPNASGAYTPGELPQISAADGEGKVITGVENEGFLELKGEIKASDKTLTGLSQAVTVDAPNYYANFYSSDVKFISISADYDAEAGFSNTTVTSTKTGVQAADIKSAITENEDSCGALAFIEQASASDTTMVVTAVVLMNIDSAAGTTLDSILYLPTAKVGDAEIVASVGETVMKDTNDKNVTVNLYSGYVNGEKKSIPSTSVPAVKFDGTTTEGAAVANTAGFYTMTENEKLPGSYILKAFEPADTADTKSVASQAITNGYGKVLVVGDVALDASGATVVDVRLNKDVSLSTTTDGLVKACKTNTITISAIYDAETGAASVIYIESAAAKAEDGGEDGPDPATKYSITLPDAVTDEGVTVSVECKKTDDNTPVNNGDEVDENTGVTFTVKVTGNATGNSKTFTIKKDGEAVTSVNGGSPTNCEASNGVISITNGGNANTSGEWTFTANITADTEITIE